MAYCSTLPMADPALGMVPIAALTRSGAWRAIRAVQSGLAGTMRLARIPGETYLFGVGVARQDVSAFGADTVGGANQAGLPRNVKGLASAGLVSAADLPRGARGGQSRRGIAQDVVARFREQYMTIPEVAEALGVSPSRVKQYAQCGLLHPAKPLGGSGVGSGTTTGGPKIFVRDEVMAIARDEYVSAITAAKQLGVGTRALINQAVIDNVFVRYIADGSGSRPIHLPRSYVDRHVRRCEHHATIESDRAACQRCGATAPRIEAT